MSQLMNLVTETISFNNYINFDLIWNTGIGFEILSTQSELIYNIKKYLNN